MNFVENSFLSEQRERSSIVLMIGANGHPSSFVFRRNAQYARRNTK
ncbi:MAG: hypothetical protein V1739_05945 [Candidatus Omnitrophota bacterium]